MASAQRQQGPVWRIYPATKPRGSQGMQDLRLGSLFSLSSAPSPLSRAEGHFAMRITSWKGSSPSVSNLRNADLAASQAVNPLIN